MKARLDPSLTPTVLQAVAKAACDQVEQEYGFYQASLDGHAPPTLEQPAHVASRLRGMERCLQLSLSRCEVDAFFGYGAALTNSTVGKDVKLDPLSQRYVTREAMTGYAAGLAKSAHRADLLSAHLSPHPLTITESEIELPAGVLDALQKDPAADKDLLHQVHAAVIKAESAGKTESVDPFCGQQGAPVGPGQNNEALWRSSFKLSELWTAFTAFKAKKSNGGRPAHTLPAEPKRCRKIPGRRVMCSHARVCRR